MKKYLLLLFVVTSFNSYGQGFQKTYGDSIENYGIFFLTAPDSGFHLYCQTNLRQDIIRIDAIGDSMHTISFNTYPTRAICTNCTNEFVVAKTTFDTVGVNQYADTIRLIKLDTVGNVLSTWIYTDTVFASVSIITGTNDNGFIMGSGIWLPPYNQSNIFLMKVDSAGNLQWKKTFLPYNGQCWEWILDLQETPDHFFIAEIQLGSCSNWTGPKKLVKIDPNGNIVWETWLTYGYAGSSSGPQQFAITDTGYIYVDNTGYSHGGGISYSRISMVDTGGVLQWSKVFYNNSSGYSGIIKTANDDFYLYGGIDNSSGAQALVTKLDQQADSLESYIYTFDANVVWPSFMQVFPDNGFGLIGTIRMNSISNNSDVFFVVADSTGTIITSSKDLKNNKIDFSIYPNPTTDQFTIISSELNDKNSRLEIFNVLGEKIYSVALTNKQQTINHKLNAGIYLVKVLNGEKQSAKKLMVE